MNRWLTHTILIISAILYIGALMCLLKVPADLIRFEPPEVTPRIKKKFEITREEMILHSFKLYKYAYPTHPVGSGGGVISFSGKHYALSANHICSINKFLYARNDLRGDKVIEPLKILARDPLNDVCLLSPPNKFKLKYYRLAPTSPKNGSHMSYVSQFSKNGDQFFGTLLIKTINRTITSNRYERDECIKGMGGEFIGGFCRISLIYSDTNLYTYPGTSGSSIINDNGEVVGIVILTEGGIVKWEAIKNLIETYEKNTNGN